MGTEVPSGVQGRAIVNPGLGGGHEDRVASAKGARIEALKR